MPDDKLPLILHPGSGLALIEPQGGRIISEMVNDVLSRSRAAEMGIRDESLSSEGWFQKGQSHYYGRNATQSYAEAERCYAIAAKDGHCDALCNLGCMLINKSDGKAACRLFETASEFGHAASSRNLGELLLEGRIVPEDLRKGIACHRRSDPLWWLRSESHSLAVLNDEQAGSAMFESLVNFCQPTPKERLDKLITVYETAALTTEQIIRRSENSSYSRVLHQVRLEASCSINFADYILVLDSGDGDLMCGAVIEFSAFEAHSDWVCNQGGLPPMGLVCNPTKDAIPANEYLSEFLVGKLVDGTIELAPSCRELSRSQVMVGSFYQRGLGVHKNDAEALRWYTMAASNGFCRASV